MDKAACADREFVLRWRSERGARHCVLCYGACNTEGGSPFPDVTVLKPSLHAAYHILVPSQVVHIFSHIHQTYVVYSLCLDGDVVLDTASSPSRWVTEEEFRASAVSTAMKKVPGGPGMFHSLHEVLSVPLASP